MNQKLINKLVDMEHEIVPTLFKPVQFEVIKKLKEGKKLNENEKRYLRGNIRKKLEIIGNMGFEGDTLFLNHLDSYYITGLEALKHNGYGWFFDIKIVEVINTKIEGMIRMKNKMFKFIRVKSIGKSDYKISEGIKYATNEQIFKDVRITKNKYVEVVWKEMLRRYGKMFLRNYSKYGDLMKESKINYSRYGV